jgi:hypothetical protein
MMTNDHSLVAVQLQLAAAIDAGTNRQVAFTTGLQQLLLLIYHT